MRILLDECLDWRLARELPSHEVKTVGQMRWNGLQNGDLLTRAEKQFDAFITVDRNLSYQQNTSRYDLVMLVLRAKSNRLRELRPLLPALRAALENKPAARTLILIG
jgi:predicted nuclease of predicted toxin-antitoxin system